MNIPGRPKIVVLGMMTKMPVAGVVWQNVHYLVGLERLGYEVYYVEAHARTPSMFMETAEDDASARAAGFIDGVMRRFDLGGRWAFHALHEENPRVYGMSQGQLFALYREAAVIINLHGGTLPRPEHTATGRLVYLETDPVEVQVALGRHDAETIDYLSQHCAFFTFGENYGRPGCKLPISPRFSFRPTRQPVVIDLWRGFGRGDGSTFTTVGNWRQHWRAVQMDGQTYTWSKHEEFCKFLDLPQKTGQAFELALSSYEPEDQKLLEDHGWRVRHALDFSKDLDAYREYIAGSRAEFTVAKDQNIRLLSGWFSDRSATYLAAGRPVITQSTGFEQILPVGEGLFGFSSLDEAADATQRINADYRRHSDAAAAIARECFSHEVVLGQLLADLGLERRVAQHQSPVSDSLGRSFADEPLPFSADMVLEPRSRRPLVLPSQTLQAIAHTPLPRGARIVGQKPRVSIVVVTRNHLPVTRLCLETLLGLIPREQYELIVVDNASGDGTFLYLQHLQAAYTNVRVIRNHENRGFATANNQGLCLAAGEVLILLNNDTIPGANLLKMAEYLRDDPSLGLIGPVTNRIANAARIETRYINYGGLMRFGYERARSHAGQLREMPALAMFCLAMRRDIYQGIGPLDEQFGLGLFEDDDYSMRVRAAGARLACAEDVFVHHFGETSFGDLAGSGQYAQLMAENQRRFEAKWKVKWKPHPGPQIDGYERLVSRVRELLATLLPRDARVAVVSRGDDRLLEIPVERATHFPQAPQGGYAGGHPGGSAEAVNLLEEARREGVEYLVLPSTAFWWLEHYTGLRAYLESSCEAVFTDESVIVYRLQCVSAVAG